MEKHEHHRNWTQTLAAEIAEIKKRRADPRGAEQNLVGLAFSGGGIRSATFGLGVLESLKRLGWLKRVDYLSTVSGGGYIGAWLSAGCRRYSGWLEPTADWNESIGHLRRYSNYLSPKVGFFSADTWSMATIWLRNTLLIQTTVILAMAGVLMLPRPLFELFQHWPDMGNLRWVTIILFVLGAVGIAGNQVRVTGHGGVPWLRAKSWLLGTVAGTVCLAAGWAYGQYVGFDPFGGGAISYAAAAPIALALVAGGFALQPVAVRLVALVYQSQGAEPPEQVNYTQAWVQGAVVVPLMMAAFLVTAILWAESVGVPTAAPAPDRIVLSGLSSYGEFLTRAWRYWPFPLSVVFASLVLLSLCSVSWRDWKSGPAAVTAATVGIAVLHALLCAVMLMFHGWSRDAGAWKAFVWGPPLVSGAFVLTIVAVIGTIGRQSTDGVREWWSRLAAWLGIYATAWMVISVSAVYAPYWVHLMAQTHPWAALTASGGWIGTVIAGLFAGGAESTSGAATKKSALTTAKEAVAAVVPFLFIAGLLIGVSFLLDVLIETNASRSWGTIAAAQNHADHGAFLRVSLAVWGACIAALIFVAARVDINEFSLNAFYRHRLVRCYLGASRCAPGERQPQNFTGFDDQDDIRLADLVDPEGGPAPGPLHIVNCALNLGGSSDLALHTRHSAGFTLTPLTCGSGYPSRTQSGNTEELGYVATREYGGPLGTPTLGQAISVSGAAASPNMGYHTSPVVAFLLTVFNVRLGWWFPNPGGEDVAMPSPHFNLPYLFAELLGGATDKSKFVMISDGGHFENLAAYELVRRRCRTIVISDGECDPALAFEGLGTLIRMCEVDFGAKITIDVSALRAASPSTWSTKRFAVGTITYGDGSPQGTLIYLKASMTGREDTAVLQYKASHHTFPHESTGDQFYREDQFESYRALGREVAQEAFESATG